MRTVSAAREKEHRSYCFVLCTLSLFIATAVLRIRHTATMTAGSSHNPTTLLHVKGYCQPADTSGIRQKINLRHSCTQNNYLRGTIVNRTKYCELKTGEYIGFCVYHRSYSLWSPVAITLRQDNASKQDRQEHSPSSSGHGTTKIALDRYQQPAVPPPDTAPSASDHCSLLLCCCCCRCCRFFAETIQPRSTRTLQCWALCVPKRSNRKNGDKQARSDLSRPRQSRP